METNKDLNYYKFLKFLNDILWENDINIVNAY